MATADKRVGVTVTTGVLRRWGGGSRRLADGGGVDKRWVGAAREREASFETTDGVATAVFEELGVISPLTVCEGGADACRVGVLLSVGGEEVLGEHRGTVLTGCESRWKLGAKDDRDVEARAG